MAIHSDPTTGRRGFRLALAALCCAAGMMPERIWAEEILFSDDFAAGLSSAWTVVDEGTHYRPSQWAVTGGVLEQSSNIHDNTNDRNLLPKLGTYLLTGDPNWTDYSVSLRMLATDNDAFGVMFGYQDAKNYYRFSMDQSRAYRRVVKFVNGTVARLAEDAVPYEQNRWYTVEIRFTGGVIEVWLDGQRLFQIADTSHSAGRIALYCWGQAVAQFDDVVVKSLSAQAPSCTYAISPTQADFAAGGGSGSVNVTAGSTCAWTAKSDASWISISGGSSGTGNGTVAYNVQANTDSASRQGTLSVAGMTFTVTQAGALAPPSCSPSISPTGASVAAAGGSGSVSVTTGAGCNWSAVSNASWISITSGTSGSGSGMVSFSVASNPSTSQRQGVVTIAGLTFTVTQAGSGCTYSVTPTEAMYGPGTATGSVKVYTSDWRCGWNAQSQVSWISFPNGSSFPGPGTIQYAVQANTGPPRMGTMTIAGTTFTVWQAGKDGAVTLWYIPPGRKIQPMLDQAQLGDTILLEPGAVYREFLKLRKKDGTGVLTITTADPSLLPPPGVRITPPYFASLPKIVSPDNRPAITTEPGAHHYRLVGLEVAGPPGRYLSARIELGSFSQSSLAEVPSHIELDRMYIHGDPSAGGHRGVVLNSAHTVVRNCYFADFKSRDQETQAINGSTGPGPFLIENNYLEAAGENIMFGASPAKTPELTPSDITVRRNHLYKPLSWCPRHPSYAGTTWIVKNLFELKNARRVLVEENIMENNWQQAQNGFAVLLTVRTYYGQMPWAAVEDVILRRNIIRHSGGGINLLGRDDLGNYQGITRRIRIEDNLIYDIDSSKWGGEGRLFHILQGVEDLVINHNTLQQNKHLAVFGGLPSPRLIFTNNIAPTNVYGLLGTGTTTGFPTFAVYCPDIVLAGNVLAGGPASKYPPNNYFPPDLASVGFVDLSADDFRLSPSSPYRKAGTDGKDVGADINAVLAATAGVIQ